MPLKGYFEQISVPKLENVPILIAADGSFPVEANRYMDERSLGEWAPPWLDEKQDDPTIQTLKSRKNIATRLIAFLYWCQQDSSRNWRAMSYEEDIIGSFQVGLLSGTGSASRKPLKPDTINLYVDEACLFLTWSAERGYRPKFKVPRRRTRVVKNRGNHSRNYKSGSHSERVGALKRSASDFDSLPSSAEIERWIKSIAIANNVKALIFIFICRTGARISEANLMRVSCFPRKASGPNSDDWPIEWLTQGYVPVVLKYGVKGGKVTPASELSVRERCIEVPIELANRIWHYVQYMRPTLLSRHHKGARARDQRTDRLWLGEKKCQPVSNQALYSAWVKSPYCPSGWHPHAGRHYFAVQKIIDATKQLLAFHKINDVNGVSLGWIHGLMAGQVRLILSPLLGHVDDRTTMLYLRCAIKQMARELGHPSIRWNEIIDADENDQEEFL